MDIGPLLQQYRPLVVSGAVRELPGVLRILGRDKIATNYTEIYHAVWKSPDGQRIHVAVKKFKALTRRSIHNDLQTLRKKLDKVGTSELLYKPISHMLLYSVSNEK